LRHFARSNGCAFARPRAHATAVAIGRCEDNRGRSFPCAASSTCFINSASGLRPPLTGKALAAKALASCHVTYSFAPRFRKGFTREALWPPCFGRNSPDRHGKICSCLGGFDHFGKSTVGRGSRSKHQPAAPYIGAWVRAFHGCSLKVADLRHRREPRRLYRLQISL